MRKVAYWYALNELSTRRFMIDCMINCKDLYDDEEDELILKVNSLENLFDSTKHLWETFMNNQYEEIGEEFLEWKDWIDEQVREFIHAIEDGEVEIEKLYKGFQNILKKVSDELYSLQLKLELAGF